MSFPSLPNARNTSPTGAGGARPSLRARSERKAEPDHAEVHGSVASRSSQPVSRLIDCAECALQESVACGDCVVSALLGAPAVDSVPARRASHVRLVAPWERRGRERVVTMSNEEEVLLALLHSSGLAPTCRYIPAAG